MRESGSVHIVQVQHKLYAHAVLPDAILAMDVKEARIRPCLLVLAKHFAMCDVLEVVEHCSEGARNTYA